jgi:hypothetical protein
MATLAAAIMGAATFSAIAQDSVVVKLYPCVSNERSYDDRLYFAVSFRVSH